MKRWATRNVVVLGLVSFFTDAHSETILALLPQFLANVLGLPKLAIGVIEGLSEGSASALNIASGWLSDRLRARKGFATTGYGVSTVAKACWTVVGGLASALAVRIVDRFGKGIRTAPRDAMLAASVDAEVRGRAFGFHRAMDTGGAVLGSVAAFALLAALAGDYRMAFAIAAIPGTLAVLLVAFWAEEVTPKPTERSDEERPARVTPELVRFVIVNTLFSLGSFSYAFFLLRTEAAGVEAIWVPMVYVAYNVIYALCALPAGALVDRYGRRVTVLGAYMLFGLSCLVMALANLPWIAILGMAMYALHSALVHPASRALVSDLSREVGRGTAMGWYHGTMGIAALVASGAAGLLWDRVSPDAPFYLGLGLSAAATIVGAAMLVTPGARE